MDPNPSWDITAPVVAPGIHGRSHAEGQVLVGLRDAESREPFLQAASASGYALVGEIPRLRVLKLSCSPGSEFAAVSELRGLPGVAFAETNGLGSVAGVDDLDDPCVPDQWHLKNDGTSGGAAGADLDMDGAWSITTGAAGVVVAVLDTGIEFDHPEFIGRLVPGYDFFSEDPDPTSDGNHGHATAGLIAAIANNGYAGAGLDQACSIMPVKVLSDTGSGNAFDLAQGIDYVASAGVDVVNMSLGYPDSQATLEAALHAAHDAGCILIAASGNFGSGTADTTWPSASPDTVSVGATNKNDQKPFFSSTGKAVDFVAPGGATVSSFSMTWISPCDDWSGTSFACALTSGVASLLLSIRPDLTQGGAYALLAAGAKDQVGFPTEDLPGWDKNYGYGRISAGASLKILKRLLSNEGAEGVPSHVDYFKGGHQLIVTRVDPELRGSPWITLGSVTGSSPGMWLGHLHLPLNSDRYFVETLAGSSGILNPAFGIVPDDGVILQSVDVPAKWQPGFAVEQLEHAVVVVHSPPFVSNSVPLAIDP